MNGLTEVVFIIDRSGSMGGLELDTIGGFNGMLDKQRKEEGEALVSTVLFDDVCEVLHDRVPIDKVPKMTDKQYYVRGCTALLDAVGDAIKHIGNVHKYARKEDVPDKTLFIITTDGMENASHKYSYEKVREMIKKEEKKYGWEFIFIGANIDSVAEAGRIGIRPTRAVNYIHDELGTANVYNSVNKAIKAVRMSTYSDCSVSLDESAWDEDVRCDYEERKRK